MGADLGDVCAELEAVACIFGALDNPQEAAAMSGGELEGDRFLYRTTLGPCKLKLVMAPEKDAIRERAERLKKSARAIGRLGTYRKPRVPSLKRAKRSRAVAQRFIDDGEKDNWKAYDELYK